MANISVHRDQPNKAIAQARTWDPFRGMRALFGWDPFSGTLPSLLSEAQTFDPAFDIKDTKEGLVFSADLPGIKDSDLDVRLDQGLLTVSGKRESEKTDKSETYYSFERSFGSFTRSFSLPSGMDTDKTHAELKDGVLRVLIPRKPGAEPKKVAVKST